MKKGTMLIVSFVALGALVLPASAFAQSASTKAAPSRDIRRPAPVWGAWGGVLRQDLYDRNNPNNLRSDWPSPPRQAGSL
jgi:hypothetical protein